MASAFSWEPEKVPFRQGLSRSAIPLRREHSPGGRKTTVSPRTSVDSNPSAVLAANSIGRQKTTISPWHQHPLGSKKKYHFAKDYHGQQNLSAVSILLAAGKLPFRRRLQSIAIPPLCSRDLGSREFTSSNPYPLSAVSSLLVARNPISSRLLVASNPYPLLAAY